MRKRPGVMLRCLRMNVKVHAAEQREAAISTLPMSEVSAAQQRGRWQRESGGAMKLEHPLWSRGH